MNKLTTAQKKALFERKTNFRNNMAVAETEGKDCNAVGRYAYPQRPRAHQSHHNNMSGNTQMHNPNTRPLSITIQNTGTTVENAILFGANATTQQSGANIVITSRTASSIEAINNEVISKPIELYKVKIQAGKEEQVSHIWKLTSADLYGGGTTDIFIPEMHQKPSDNNKTLIEAYLPEFTASGNNWMEIPVEPGNTMTINFTPAGQLSLEGIVNGTHTVE